MDEEIVDRVTGWDSVTGPAATDLRSLARDEFSGAVTTGTAWAFLLNGRIVGLFDGDLDDFEAGDLTVYSAPDPALPLLWSMQETGGETRGKYYSEETSLREVDRTLSSGKFTGYVELSENVLSGDYYVVYHGGRSMSVAFVGASERLVTGDEAFDLADDEVGIFTVNAVDVTVTDVPEPADDAASGGAVGGTDAASAGPVEATDAGDDEDDAPADDDRRQEGVTFGASDAGETGADEPTGDAASAPATSDAESDRYEGLMGDMGIGLDSGDDAAESSPDDSASPVDDEPASTTGDDPPESPAASDRPAEAATDFDDPDRPADAADAGESPATDERESDEVHANRPDDDPASGDGDDDAEQSGRAGTGDDGDAPEDGDRGDADGRDAQDPDEPHDASAESADADGAVAVTNGEAADEDDPATSTERERDDEVTSAGRDDTAAAATTGTEDGRTPRDGDEPDSGASVGRDESGVFSAERQWQRTKRIPALSPDDSMERQDDSMERQEMTTAGAAADTQKPRDVGKTGTADPTASADSDDGVAPTADGREDTTTGEDAGDASDLAARLERVRAERDELAAAVESLEGDVESVTRERDRLRTRVADLESELATLREEADRETASDAPQLSAAAAREGTNLFVRYRSKGKPTLKKAQAGEAKQGEVVENLRLEYHTTFDSDRATVDGESYESFLHGTTEWGFATWVVEELLYEIGRSGHRVDLAPLFDRIPEIDRIEFDGTVPVTVDDEAGGERHEGRTFDLVFWNSMGDPLFVVDVDTSRDASTQGMVGSLVEGARAVGESKDTLGGAFYVTTSFFEPGALDAVDEATKSGLLSRSSKKSFVKLSRKRGYHLCLVEARDGEFHLTVPEL